MGRGGLDKDAQIFAISWFRSSLVYYRKSMNVDEVTKSRSFEIILLGCFHVSRLYGEGTMLPRTRPILVWA